MKKIISLSLVTTLSIFAANIELTPINVESTIITEVSENAQLSADIAVSLNESVPSIDMSRRSAIANDIYIRGQKRDNISVVVDGTKVQGACVNRMDPPVSHIIANQIQKIEVIEGPYDVETFGTMSGGVKIKTKKPQAEFSGDVDLGYGSFNYKKAGLSVSGGTDKVRFSLTASLESSDQYEDGNGDTLAEQIDNYVDANPTLRTAMGGAMDPSFQPEYHDMKAYDKKSVMGKIFINPVDNQEIRLSYTANRSDDILYTNSKMEALYDDSNIYNIEYEIKDLTDKYKNITLQYYYSDVDHPMGTDYRMSSLNSGSVMLNHLKTTMKGTKLKSEFDLNSHKLIIGLDGSLRTWDGNYFKNGVPLTDTLTSAEKSIDYSETKNMAIFAKLDKSYGNLDVSLGARYDSTTITSADADLQDNDYTGLNLSILSTYNIDDNNKIFLGIGQASRVPDARELYFTGSKGNLSGTPDLEQTTNQEVDFGYEINNDTYKFKIKGFYSQLSDYIYIESGVTTNAFQNIDATVYGTELSASIYPTDDISVDMSASYKVGKKDEALDGQSDKNLADMAPLRVTVSVNYEYMNEGLATLTFRASDTWDTYDADNGEQELDSWSIVNLKAKHTFMKSLELTLGVNNLFNKSYTESNTYADLILVTAGGDVMLTNEPGRYIYTNLKYKF